VHIDGDGKISAVAQHTHYHFRGPLLQHLSLFEYSALVTIVPSPSAVPTPPTEDGPIPVTGTPARRGAGRPCNLTFKFHPRHPLYSTHVQRLRSKVPTIALAGKAPPRLPTPALGVERNSAYRSNANIFGAFWLIVHVPWAEVDDQDYTRMGPDVHSLSWATFCKFAEDTDAAQCADSNHAQYPAWCALEYIRNVYRLGTSRNERMLLSSFRYRGATVFGDGDSLASSLAPDGALEIDDEDPSDQTPPGRDSVALIIERIRDSHRADDTATTETARIHQQECKSYIATTIGTVSFVQRGGDGIISDGRSAGIRTMEKSGVVQAFKLIVKGDPMPDATGDSGEEDDEADGSGEEDASTEGAEAEGNRTEDTDHAAPRSSDPMDMDMLGHMTEDAPGPTTDPQLAFFADRLDAGMRSALLQDNQQPPFLQILGALRNIARSRLYKELLVQVSLHCIAALLNPSDLVACTFL
jgi:hypothetical protein